MARTKTIDYQRVTFSFPKKVVNMLRIKIPNNEMSKYVSQLVESDLENKKDDVDEFIESLREFASRVKPRTDKTTLEILREIRYGKDR